jgi:hypothetical protein
MPIVERGVIMRSFPSSSIKWSYVTRGMPEGLQTSIGAHAAAPRSGDLVLARVVSLGAHGHLENRHGRRMRLYRGDIIVGTYGNRYATDFYEGYVPEGAICHLLTAGGLIGTVASRHEAQHEPTELEVLGAVLDADGRPLSTETFAREIPALEIPRVATVAVVGSGMNAGKTTTVAGLVHGFTRTGFATGAGKVTGSGSGKDRWAYIDAGADPVLEFLDFGMPSTFGYDISRLSATMMGIRSALALEGADVAVLELADGLLQEDTHHLLGDLAGVADAVVLASVDALSAQAGVEVLTGLGLPIVAISGLVTRSPLAVRETERATNLPVVRPGDLAAHASLPRLFGQVAAA